MNQLPLRRALLSVSDKTGLIGLARRLVDAGVELISTGGTARHLREGGLPVRAVSEVTGAPEIFGGRVKTLHPNIHGGILGRWDEATDRAEAEALGITPIGLVVVNLYPFGETIRRAGVTEAEAREQIDIGGPCMVRAAAKNHPHVLVLVDPADYEEAATAVAQAKVTAALRTRLAAKAFALTSAYDAEVAGYLATEAARVVDAQAAEAAEAGGPEAGGPEANVSETSPPLPTRLAVVAGPARALRYGENPHQRAAFYPLDTPPGHPSLATAELIWGKPLSYNNLLDLDAALQIAVDLASPGAVVVKHGNPCGAAEGHGAPSGDPAGTLEAVYRRARATDPDSAFGGIVGLNCEVAEATARALAETFLECVIAPGFSEAARGILTRKRDLRLLAHAPWPTRAQHLEIRRIAGGLLVQDSDTSVESVRAAEVVTARAPTEVEWASLGLAWRIGRHVKSNAIVFARPGQVIGIGAGQMSRVDSSRLAADKAARAGHALDGAGVASDAFFPFADAVEAAAGAGATAIVQPGGSKRDAEVIAAADRLGLAMVFTGVRHFRH